MQMRNREEIMKFKHIRSKFWIKIIISSNRLFTKACRGEIGTNLNISEKRSWQDTVDLFLIYRQ